MIRANTRRIITTVQHAQRLRYVSVCQDVRDAMGALLPACSYRSVAVWVRTRFPSPAGSLRSLTVSFINLIPKPILDRNASRDTPTSQSTEFSVSSLNARGGGKNGDSALKARFLNLRNSPRGVVATSRAIFTAAPTAFNNAPVLKELRATVSTVAWYFRGSHCENLRHRFELWSGSFAASTALGPFCILTQGET
jgi:hypothetical protein